MKFEEIWPRVFRGEVVQRCERTDGLRTGSDYNSSAFGSGELNTQMTALADELHKPIKRKFQKMPVIVVGIDDTRSADLADMTSFAKFNEGIKYL